jgi:DNA polymerase III alpha subunit
VATREKEGRYIDLEDFFQRAPMASDDRRRLALVGALDSLASELNRPQILWLIGQNTGDALSAGRRNGNAASGSLFPALESNQIRRVATVESPSRRSPPALPPYSRRRRFAAEYSALGFIPGHHPLALYEEEIRESAQAFVQRGRPRLVAAGNLSEHVGKMVVILAWPVTAKIVETKHGDAMMFQSFEYRRAICEATVFPDEFRKYHRHLTTRQPLWVTGRVEEEFGVAMLRVMRIEPMLGGDVTEEEEELTRP